MTTTLELHVRKIQWSCQQGEGFCMHVFSTNSYSVCFFYQTRLAFLHAKTLVRHS